MLSIFEIAALLLGLSALFGWFNLRILRLPHTIGLLIIAFASSVVLIALEKLVPGLGITQSVKTALEQIDLYTAIINGMLAFLLFAGALHVDIDLLKGQKWAIGLMATIGVLISTLIVGFGIQLACRLFGYDLPIVWALVFGALISPTDPVAVLGLLKFVAVPETIKAKITGESLFNDGAAVVIFVALLTVALGVPAAQGDQAHWEPGSLLSLFLFQAVGGIRFWLLTGWIAFRAMASIDDPMVEILISIAVCVATYALSLRLHFSGPIAIVVTGLLIGSHGAEYAMSEKVKEYLFSFWEVIDEVLNVWLPVPSHRTRGAGDRRQPPERLDHRRCDPRGLAGQICIGFGANSAAVGSSDLFARRHSHFDLGRLEGRRFGCARALASPHGIQIDHSNRHLRGGDLFDRRARPDGEGAHRAYRRQH